MALVDGLDGNLNHFFNFFLCILEKSIETDHVFLFFFGGGGLFTAYEVINFDFSTV